MAQAPRSDTEPLRLRIEGEMTIYRAAELKQTLLDALDSSAALEVDLSAVTDLDTAGVQLLMMTRKYARAAERELRLVAPSPVVTEVIELLNLGTYFSDPLTARAGAGSSP
jgi:anti-sigma B factor antagonist